MDVQDYAVVADSQPVVRGIHELLDEPVRFLPQLADLLEDSVSHGTVEFLELA